MKTLMFTYQSCCYPQAPALWRGLCSIRWRRSSEIQMLCMFVRICWRGTYKESECVLSRVVACNTCIGQGYILRVHQAHTQRAADKKHITLEGRYSAHHQNWSLVNTCAYITTDIWSTNSRTLRRKPVVHYAYSFIQRSKTNTIKPSIRYKNITIPRKPTQGTAIRHAVGPYNY
jgi:hypothetical protein